MIRIGGWASEAGGSYQSGEDQSGEEKGGEEKRIGGGMGELGMGVSALTG